MNKLVSLKNKLGSTAKSKKGFTLVEMIIVMVIMALLAAALIPTMMGYVNDARNNSNLATARAYYVAAQSIATELSATKSATEVNEAAIMGADAAHPTARWTELTAGLAGKGAVTDIVVDTYSVTKLVYTPTDTKAKPVTITPGGTATFG